MYIIHVCFYTHTHSSQTSHRKYTHSQSTPSPNRELRKRYARRRVVAFYNSEVYRIHGNDDFCREKCDGDVG